MTDDETTDVEIPEGYEVYYPSWQNPWDEDPTEGRLDDDMPIVPMLLLTLIASGLGVVADVLGVELMTWGEMLRAFGL